MSQSPPVEIAEEVVKGMMSKHPATPSACLQSLRVVVAAAAAAAAGQADVAGGADADMRWLHDLSQRTDILLTKALARESAPHLANNNRTQVTGLLGKGASRHNATTVGHPTELYLGPRCSQLG